MFCLYFSGATREQMVAHTASSGRRARRRRSRIDIPRREGDFRRMDVHELVVEMKLLERRLTLYEEKYGVLSEDFYAALSSGKLARYDGFDESRADFSRWKGIYETWRRRKAAYDERIK